VLDEPSSGLDPIVRRDILGAVIKTVADEGRTVLFSSHLLDEVERVSDHVALLAHGRVVYAGPLDDLKAGHHRLTVLFDGFRPKPPALVGALAWEGEGREWTALCRGGLGELQAAAEAAGGRVVERGVPSLDEIFVAHAGGSTT
jgi:ABC-2 type transport system ATP-binding protein